MEIHFKVAGSLMLFLSLIHVFFPRYFKWKEDLTSLSLINRQMMLVHTLFIAIVVFLMGLMCLVLSKDMSETSFGKKISLGLFIFWGARLYVQFFGYSGELWKGKKFETSIHILMIFIWLYFTVIFFVNFLSLFNN